MKNRKFGGLRVAEDNFDLGTEEEDEIDPYTLFGRAVDNDEDSSSVPEDAPGSAAGNLYGGRVLRPRKRRVSVRAFILLILTYCYHCPSNSAVYSSKNKNGLQNSRSPSGSAPPERRGRNGEERLRGLRNLGNTCYFNSVVQALKYANFSIKIVSIQHD